MPAEYFEARERALLGERYELLYAAPKETAARGVTVSALRTTPEEYRASTGFECLLGWLYLNGQLSRVHELFETLWQSFDPNEK